MKIAFIHNEKKLGTGAHFINDLIASCLRNIGVRVKNFYPKNPLLETPVHLKGMGNILFFYSLLEAKDEVLKYDLIQGTTYTPLAFLMFPIPVVSHFGSTSWGFLQAVPLAKDMKGDLRRIWLALKKAGVIRHLNLQTQRPLRDVAEIEKLVARRADAIIATSDIVRKDLLAVGVSEKKIFTVPNAIEDYWFTRKKIKITEKPSLVFLGRLGTDVFTLKLKGLDRLVDFYQHFADIQKCTIGMTNNKNLVHWLNEQIPLHAFFENIEKKEIPNLLQTHAGDILLITSRYEGFSLSLIEGMSQGIIPVSYPVGIAPQVIEQGKNGFLINSQKEGRVVIERILRMSQKEREELASAAKKTAQKFKAATVARQLLSAYKKTLAVYKTEKML